jgi:tripartite-type tricarboxylate transporter receptor subunit TctC
MMTLPRRTFLHLTAGAFALPTVSRFAWATTRPLRIVVGMATGSAADIIARLVGQSLSERLGQPVTVDNLTGVGGNIAAETVVTAEPDGSTLLMAGPSSAINATLYEKLTFNFMREIAPVAAIAQSPNAMVVSPALPIETVSDLIRFAKSNPGVLRMASAGVGTATHLAGELFQIMAGVEMVHVPYRGGGTAAYAALLKGDVDVYFPPLASAIEPIKSARLRALAVTTPRRDRRLPVPTVGEAVPGYETSTWFGIGAPRTTPVATVRKLNLAINACLTEPTIKARLADLGGTISAGSPEDFGNLVAKETEKWASGPILTFASHFRGRYCEC